jgi:hypothetical protein
VIDGDVLRGPKAVMNMINAGWLGMVIPRLFGRRTNFECPVTKRTLTVVEWRGREYCLEFK